MSDTKISVEDFLKVRGYLANILGRDSQTQPPTRIRQAETLLTTGVIDIEAVLSSLSPTKEEDDQDGQGDTEDE